MPSCVKGWLDKDMTWLAPPDGSPGGPAVFSDAAIQFCLTIKVLFKLPLRQTTGMVASLLKLANLDWAVPDYTTLCRRQKTLVVQIPYRRADGPLNLLVDSTGIKFLGDGALSGDCFAIPCRVTNGGPESMAFRAVTRRGHTAIHCPAVHACMHERDQSPGHRDHPDPQERVAVERGLPGRDCQKPSPACHTTLWPSLLETRNTRPRPKPDRGEPSHGLRANHCRAMDAVPQILRRAHRRSRPRPTNRRNPNPHRTHEPLQRPRHRRDHPRGLKLKRKGALIPTAFWSDSFRIPKPREV
jgi:hypothetical protein